MQLNNIILNMSLIGQSFTERMTLKFHPNIVSYSTINWMTKIIPAKLCDVVIA